MDPPEIAEDERVARLRLVGRPLGQAEVPFAVFLPRMALEEPVLVRRPRLALTPIAAEDVAPRFDQVASMRQRDLVDGVRGHRPSLPPTVNPPIKASSDGLAGCSRSASQPRPEVLYGLTAWIWMLAAALGPLHGGGSTVPGTSR